MLPARYFESSCGQCHMDKPAGTPRLNAGRALLARYGCVHCHALTLPDGARLTPADDPPSLEHISPKRQRANGCLPGSRIRRLMRAPPPCPTFS